MANTTVAFLCYDRHDDRDRSVSSFRVALTEALVSKGAGPVEIFQDRVNIRWGENWRDRIRGALDETPLLVPIVTPNFLQSDECRDELEYFLEGEDRRRRWDLILPVYFYPVRKIDDREPIAGDYLIAELRRRQWQDWIDLRAEAPDSPRRIAYLGRRPSIHHNRIHDGNQEGIYIGEGASGLIEDNEIVKNRFAGIAIRADANPKSEETGSTAAFAKGFTSAITDAD